MKTKILLTLIFAVSMQFCFGQEYHTLIDTNKIWSVLLINGTNPYYKSTHFIKFKGDTYQRIRIAQIDTDNVGIKNIKYFPINGFDPGTTFNQYSVQTGPVSTFKGTTTFEASSTDMFLKVNVNGKEYGILLWELP